MKKSKKIEIYCENTKSFHQYMIGTKLTDILKDVLPGQEKSIIGALVNNTSKDLNYQIYKPKKVFFFDYGHDEGRRMYLRSIIFVLYKACSELFPHGDLTVRHPISNGYYCTLDNTNLYLDDHNIELLKERMRSIIVADLPFNHEEILTEKAIDIFEKEGHFSKIDLLKTRGNVYTSVYSLDEDVDYFYGKLVPSTGFLENFDIIPYYKGILLRLPQINNPNELRPFIEQPKLLRVLSESRRWGKIIKAQNIGDLNRMVESGEIQDLINLSEALLNKKVAKIADEIRKQRKKLKIILIAGPTSSGKTTFSKKLEVQLRVNGMNPVKISLDNYFVNREDNPVDENGELDFETIDALDLPLFNADLLKLIKGEEVEMPKFSFEKGERYYDGEFLSVKKRDLIILEGIHALNPKLTREIPDEVKFRIYISALTSISIDNHNLIKTSDNRLIRRIVRDAKFRNYSAAETIKRWPSVRRGEFKHIFPFQENADAMVNTALLYELSVLKNYAKPILEEVKPTLPEYYTAQRLLKFFSYFLPVEDQHIPPTSILKEFLGGSSFSYD
ncbi:MAG: AAA family ATPase [Bacteroidetes bacterium]|nr:MAG: AAA family ATPase [Bacteroidota bacterium]